MPLGNEELSLTILAGTFIVLLFSISTFFLFKLFNKKNQLHQKEKEIVKSNFDAILLQSQLEIQEASFNLISQEIHDNVGQILSLVKMQLNLMEEKEIKDNELLIDVKENVSKAMTDLRDIAKGLNGDRIIQVGFTNALLQEVQRINRTGIIQIDLQFYESRININPQKQLILFRIIQECLQNIIKHASASRASISINYSDTILQVTVRDNGRGFVSENILDSTSGLGFRNIFKRMKMIGGSVEVKSVPNEGTSIYLQLSFENNDS